jgi:DNA-binding NtrC family response regulator
VLEVLVADDDENVRVCVTSALVSAGHRVMEATDGAHAVELMASHAFDLAICDVHMPRLGGLALLRRIRREAPRTAVVIMTGFGEISEVVGSMRDGAVDFVTKPFDPDEFTRTVVKEIAERRALRTRLDGVADRVVCDTGTALVTESPAMQAVVERIQVIAKTDAPALISGDRGTGKERVARALHAQGPRRSGPFVIADGTQIRESLQDVEECMQRAMGGTLVLDGIEKLSLRAQVHLLRVVDGPGTAARRGPERQPLGVRLLTLTRENLPVGAASAELLDALHYRLSGVRLHVPTLRERGPDLYPLVMHLIDELEPPRISRRIFTKSAWKALSRYAFPGNVRELRSILGHVLVRADGRAIDADHLPPEVLCGST